ncbi:aminotransferase class V-fold PLP-dependent enzyme [Pseudomonas fontis]|uniref:Aminotransferase class V-fold PLP-dependent enzyme n=1 Tax=Pseudomonas fontis TaxID=2942633 RepID=A0ABT5NSW9_9PSED|nr:aminotransferase class V-fold PLP-dependent enzyme [Pseudomonas fontis]MDD0975197.1 aminotransferase class V-fold PLP-dependent enzyme [Pseudomonas fontis]MDD0991261.1 aminotransferase class V-fold PLP-dependent enzyme [Pseudomonas fontis]
MTDLLLSDPSTLARDEGYWQRIAAQYDVEPGPINLEYGYFGRMTRHAGATYQQHIDAINRCNSLPLRQHFDDIGSVEIRNAAAELLNVPHASVALTQSASASLQTLIRNYNRLQAGDQVLVSDLDYDSVANAMRWLARQRGAEVVELSHPHPVTYDNLMQSYREAFARNPRLKLMPLTHVTHRTGLVMPIREIAALAREHGIDVVLDGAHALGQMEFDLEALGIEFAGYNLQKWIGAPLSLGLTYIAPARIGDIDPDMADSRFALDDVRSRAPYGTPNVPAWLTLPTVFAEHKAIGGAAVKGARLSYLRDLWVSQARDIEGIEVLVPDDPRLYCGITSFRFTRHADQAAMVQRLLNEYNLFTVGREGSACGPCIRVTPGFTTTPAEVQQLVDALRQLSR